MRHSKSLLLSLTTIALVLVIADGKDARRARRSSGEQACFSPTAGDDDTISGCTEYLSGGASDYPHLTRTICTC
ncbi:hypothetical protein [Rhodoplanes sp. SY1]|uniref:hypothetical protein n=1 Tax=Rhodoplanes sp. SY1 TaxID=3166646 RepID=UPI0038B5D8B1